MRRLLGFLFWLYVVYVGFEFASHSLFWVELFLPFVFLIALFTLAVEKLDAR